MAQDTDREGWQMKRCWYMPMKLGAYWKRFGAGSADGLGIFSGMTTYSTTLSKGKCWARLLRVALPGHHSVVALGQLLTPVCLLSPSSRIWYRPRAVILSSWEGNGRPGRKYLQPATWFKTVTCGCGLIAKSLGLALTRHLLVDCGTALSFYMLCSVIG